MKLLKLIFFFVSLFICNFAYAETYYVNTEVLNLRSCAGTNCKILGKLTSGEAIEVLENSGEWVKVQTDKGEGFVIKKSITKDSDSISGFFVLFVLIVLGYIWFLPTVISSTHTNHRKIFWLNLIIGWIPLIWLILLIVAITGDRRID